MRYWGQHRYRIPITEEGRRRIERFRPFIGKGVLTEAVLRAGQSWGVPPANGGFDPVGRLKVKMGHAFEESPSELGALLESSLALYEARHRPTDFRPGHRLKRMVYLPGPLLANHAFTAVREGRHIDDDLGEMLDSTLASIMDDTRYWTAQPQ